MTQPKTLTAAIRYYSDEQTCINAVAALRWPDGSPVCPKCGATQDERNHYWLAAQKRWKCRACRKQFSVKLLGSLYLRICCLVPRQNGFSSVDASELQKRRLVV